jgi:hypothetical protein
MNQIVFVLLVWAYLVANCNSLQGEISVRRQNQALNVTEGQSSSVVRRQCKQVNTADIVVIKKGRNAPTKNSDDDNGLLYCLQGTKTEAECAAARQGNFAKQEEYHNNSLLGELIMHMTNVTIMENADIIQEIHFILVHETTPAFIGCIRTRNNTESIHITEQTNTTSDDSRMEVSWINFGEITVERGTSTRTGFHGRDIVLLGKQ